MLLLRSSDVSKDLAGNKSNLHQMLFKDPLSLLYENRRAFKKSQSGRMPTHAPPAIGLGSPTHELPLHALIGSILFIDISHSVGLSSL